jgi:hypothetical protein
MNTAVTLLLCVISIMLLFYTFLKSRFVARMMYLPAGPTVSAFYSILS